MRPVLTTKTVVGQQNYNFGFDYLSKEFVRVVIDNVELNYPNDYSVNATTVSLKVAPTQVKTMVIYRKTSTVPFVKWQDSSIMTAKNMNIQEMQSLHINEETEIRYGEVKDWHAQVKDDKKIIENRALEVARNTKEVADNKTIVVAQAGMVDSYTQEVRNATASNELTKTAIDTMLPEIRRAYIDTLEKARVVDTHYNSINSSRSHVDTMVQEAKDTLDSVKAWVGGDSYTKHEVDAKIQQEATQAIANLVDNAPSALDTLQELANALDNDPNFATTITNLIGTKATLQQVYPVGAIYMSTVATSPSTLFGFGEWETIEAGRFLLAQGGKYANGSKGGSETHTLTASEMPTHNHYSNTESSGGHNHTGRTGRSGLHGHVLWSGNGRTGDGYFSQGQRYTNKASQMNDVDWSGNHEHDFTTNWDGVHTHPIKTDGGSQPHNNMPPYLAVYIWKRIN